MVVKLIEDKDLWDKHIGDSPYGTLFHKWDFMRIIEKHSGCKLYPYGIYRGEELVCTFPLFTNNILGSVMVFSPPPDMALPYLGFVMNSIYDNLKQRRKEAYVNDAIDEMEAEMKKIGANYVHISTVNGFTDSRPFKWNGYDVQLYYSYVFDLKRSIEDLSNVSIDQKGHEIGKQLSIRHTDDPDKFYDAMRAIYKEQRMDIPITSREYLRDVLAAFPDNVMMDMIYDGDKIVDLMLYHQYKKHVVQWIGLVKNEKTSNNDQIIGEYIKNKKAEDFEKLEIRDHHSKQRCPITSRLNATLDYGFNIDRKDFKGKIARNAYHSLARPQ
jgi:hypothetical protein